MSDESRAFIRKMEECLKTRIPMPGTEADTPELDAVAMQFWRDFAAACADAGITLSTSPPERKRHYACSRIHPDELQVVATLGGLKFIVLVYEPFRQHRDGRLEGIGQLNVALGQRPSSRWKSLRPRPLSERARRLVRRIQREVARVERAREEWKRQEPIRRRQELVQKRRLLRRQNRVEVRRRIHAAARRLARFERLLHVVEALQPLSAGDLRARRWLARVERYVRSIDPRVNVDEWFAKGKARDDRNRVTLPPVALDAPYPWWLKR
jgi:hypothetical protein